MVETIAELKAQLRKERIRNQNIEEIEAKGMERKQLKRAIKTEKRKRKFKDLRKVGRRFKQVGKTTAAAGKSFVKFVKKMDDKRLARQKLANKARKKTIKKVKAPKKRRTNFPSLGNEVNDIALSLPP